MSNTVKLHRVIAAKPEKVFRAFVEADAMAKWLPPNGFTCTVHEMDAREGGKYRMSFRNFTTGDEHAFGGEFLVVKPNSLLKWTDQFEDPNMPGVIEVTLEIREVSCGSEINIVQTNLPDLIPVESCYLGWQDSLRNLAALVEPDIQP